MTRCDGGHTPRDGGALIYILAAYAVMIAVGGLIISATLKPATPGAHAVPPTPADQETQGRCRAGRAGGRTAHAVVR